MYHCFDTKHFALYPQNIFTFCIMILITNCDCFPKQLYEVTVYNGEGLKESILFKITGWEVVSLSRNSDNTNIKIPIICSKPDWLLSPLHNKCLFLTLHLSHFLKLHAVLNVTLPEKRVALPGAFFKAGQDSSSLQKVMSVTLPFFSFLY
jgi:hypothetical protein